MVSCRKYNVEQKTHWDAFVLNSRTPLFFFQRDFMEYHSSRFIDYSLMFYDDEVLVAVLPANRDGEKLVSHGGLTYGGLLISMSVKTSLLIDIAKAMMIALRHDGVQHIIYKSIPYLFYQQPCQEDLYVLVNQLNARLIRRDLSSVIRLDCRLGLSKGRKWMIARAKKNGLRVTTSYDWKGFYSLLASVLEKHAVAPVHMPEELSMLKKYFPTQIDLKVVLDEIQMIAAVLLFKFKNVVHTQYIAVSEKGKELGALDYLLETIIQEAISEKYEYFNFGISTEQEGRYLNEGLVAQKESFGARAITLDHYQVDINES